MRSSRLSKYRKRYKKLKFSTKILVICYAMLLSICLVTTNTVAYLSDSEKVNSAISSSKEWWDKSDLAFTGKSSQSINACSPTEISVQIKNKGFDMYDSTKYEIYYSEDGNPEKQEEAIADGNIQPIAEGETETISFEVDNIGYYIFKVYQRPGYKNDYDTQQEIWSEKVIIECSDDKKQNDEQEKEKDEKSSDQNKEEKSESKDSSEKKVDKNTELADTKGDENKQDSDTKAENEKPSTDKTKSDTATGESSDKTKSNNVESEPKSKKRNKAADQVNKSTDKADNGSDSESVEGENKNEQSK